MDVLAPELTSACRVLEEEADLAEAIPLGERQQVARGCLAETLEVPAGRWEGPCGPWPEDRIGLLVLEGLLLARVAVGGRFGAELLGSGDLLQPSQPQGDPPMLDLRTDFQMLVPTRLAVLDGRFGEVLGRYPRLGGRLVGRALRRSHNLAVNMAIVHQARVDVRLRMLLWHLATRWGRVRSESVSLPLRLTHDVLSDLTAASRPTVSSALSQLSREGLVHADGSGWLLTGDPPGELLELGGTARQ